MGMPDHQELDTFGGLGCYPYLKQLAKLIDRAYGRRIDLERFQFVGVSRPIFVPYPNHFTIIKWFVK